MEALPVPAFSLLLMYGAHAAQADTLAALDAPLLVDSGQPVARLADGPHGANGYDGAAVVLRAARFANG